jgi:hypothetical protein
MLFKEERFQMFLEVGQGLCCPNFRGSWFHNWGAGTEKSFDWAEWKLPYCKGGRAKRPKMAEQSTQVGVKGLSIA